MNADIQEYSKSLVNNADGSSVQTLFSHLLGDQIELSSGTLEKWLRKAVQEEVRKTDWHQRRAAPALAEAHP